MAKGDKFYFENLKERAELSKQSASYLVECLDSYSSDRLDVMLKKMHELEHAADVKKHKMSDALAKAFVTPVDREDLDMLSQNLDQVSDKLEEIIQKFYIYNIQAVDPSVTAFAQKLVSSCGLLCELMAEFENFKRSKQLKALIIQLNDAEEDCDNLYISSMRKLTESSTDILSTISWREIYECFEACADACEHVGECVGTVIMKNT